MAWAGGYKLVTMPIKQSAAWFARRGDGIAAARRHPTEPPLAGAYRLQLVKAGPWVPARIWIVEHRCPEKKTLMADVEYHAELGCERGLVRLGMFPDESLKPPRDVFAIWDWWSLEICSWEEHAHLVAMLDHAITREGDLPEANPRRRVDHLTAPTIF